VTTLTDVISIDATQTEITWKHRKSLILWLLEVHGDYDLRPETLYLTVNYLDRVCAKRNIHKSEYQLLGLTCLWIAAKYEENHGRVPSPKALAVLLEHSVPVSRFAAMERVILKDLDFTLGHPSPESFLKNQCKQLKNVEPPVRALARLIMELTLLHRRFRPFRSSLLAMASLILADSLYTGRYWNRTEPVIGRIITNLEECLIQAPKQIINKYRSAKFLNISNHVKNMLDNKAACLYQIRLNSAPHMPTDQQHGHHVPTGFLTPPKDVSPFRNPWDTPNGTVVAQYHLQHPQPPQQTLPPGHHYHQQPQRPHLTPVLHHHYIQTQQPPPIPSFQLPPHPQYYQHPGYPQQQHGYGYGPQPPQPPHQQQQQLYHTILPPASTAGNPPSFQMPARNFSEVSSTYSTMQE
ncbi:hypothetical protein HDU98_004975, partial [Podochytrium sp. JEL0797]